MIVEEKQDCLFLFLFKFIMGLVSNKTENPQVENNNPPVQTGTVDGSLVAGVKIGEAAIPIPVPKVDQVTNDSSIRAGVLLGGGSVAYIPP